MMLLFGLCRILFYLFNLELFADVSFKGLLRIMYGGLRFDLTAVLYTNALYILAQAVPFRFRCADSYQKCVKWIYYCTNSVALALNCIDIIYYRFTFRRTTWSVFDEFANDKGNFALILQFLWDYWYIAPVLTGLIYIMTKLYNLVKAGKPFIGNNFVYYPVNLCILAIYAGLFVAGVRGGFKPSTRPITISNVGIYIEKPIQSGLVLNTPFSIYRTLERSAYPRLEFFDNATLETLYSPVHVRKDSADFTPKNVVIIIVESLSKEYIGALNKDLDAGNYQGYTPFIDSLITASYTFAHSFANGVKSIDAMPSILSSIPSLSEPYILSIYSNNTIKGIAALLSEKGYDCSFFHGAPNGSMGFDVFAKSSGFTHYYGMNEYGANDDFDGRWGIWDEPFLQFTAQTLNAKPQPFLASVFTLSSHHPFIVPQRYEGKFPKGTEQIHRCVGYTDMALRRFFETASQMEWFHNTLFVITADHTNQVAYEKSKTSAGRFYVPVIFYDPSGNLKGFEATKTIQQIDIMPTVLGRLNYDKPFFAFGFDVFDNDTVKESFSINYLNGFYQIYQNNYVLITNANQPETLYNYHDDPLLLNNIKDGFPDVVRRLDTLGKAFIQTYNNKLINNDMTVSE
jgi:arylsulfatase A-like enzyme